MFIGAEFVQPHTSYLHSLRAIGDDRNVNALKDFEHFLLDEFWASSARRP